MKKNYAFYAAAAAFILLVFWANSAHLNQLGVFYNYVLPQAARILHGDFAFTYPIWGYSILTSIGQAFGAPVEFLLVVQYLLAVFGVRLIYDVSRSKPSYSHLPLLLPWAALMSVKWPQAVSSFLILLIIWIYYNNSGGKSKRWGYLAIAVAFGMALNFRSEYLYFPLLAFLVISLASLIKQSKLEFKSSGMICLAMAAGTILLLPWAVNSWGVMGKPLLNSSNGGMVAYISLGDLPGNIWGVEPVDATAWRRAQEAGEPTPFTRRADSLLIGEFKANVFSRPGEYAMKCAYNSLRALGGGLYVGEYAALATTNVKALALNKQVAEAKGIEQKFKALLGGGGASILLMLEKILRLLSMPLFIYILYRALASKHSYDGARLIAVSIILYQILLCAALLYEPRMMNTVYAPALALALGSKRGKSRSRAKSPKPIPELNTGKKRANA